MKYREFREKVRQYPYFRANIFENVSKHPAYLRSQVVAWIKKGYIWQLKRGIYTLNNDDRSCELTDYVLSNALCSPSYISLESALSFYGIIPEGVYAITALTTKKTQQYNNPKGQFLYRHIKNTAFSGYTRHEDSAGNYYMIALKEKAIVDFLYFKMREIKSYSEDIFEHSFRFQNLEDIDVKQLLWYTSLYNKKKLSGLLQTLIKYMEKHRD